VGIANLYFAVGATATLAEAVWHAWLADQDGIDSMSAFLVAKNALIADEVRLCSPFGCAVARVEAATTPGGSLEESQGSP
jgi:hypothetical protein